MSVPSTREPQKIPISEITQRTKCLAVAAAFDIPEGIAAVNSEWVEVVRDFQTAEARELKLLAENLS
jgi:hypothetical protein